MATWHNWYLAKFDADGNRYSRCNLWRRCRWLKTCAGGWNGHCGGQWKQIADITLSADTTFAKDEWQSFADGTALAGIKQFCLYGVIKGISTGTSEGYVELCVNGTRLAGVQYGAQKSGNTREITIIYDMDSYPQFNCMTGRVGNSTSYSGSGNTTTAYDSHDWGVITSFGLNFPNQPQGYGAGTHLYCIGYI